MKKKDWEEIKLKKVEDLVKLLGTKRTEADMWYAKVKAGKETNTARLRILGREIAQISSIITQKLIVQKEVEK